MKNLIFSILLISTTTTLCPLTLPSAKNIGVTATALMAANVGYILALQPIKEMRLDAATTPDKKPLAWCATRLAMGASVLFCSGYVLYHEWKNSQEKRQAQQ